MEWQLPPILRRGRTRNRLVTALALAASSPSLRAAVPPPYEGIEEISVTAQRREENLQDVPFSIVALNSRTLQELKVSDFLDYAKFLPSLSHDTAAPGAIRPYFRGVANGGDINHSGPQPSVGVYLDEQPITTIEGSLDLHMYDIARVEALAGPQGTLYGASSQSGTLRVVTNKPDPAGYSASYTLEGNTVAHGDEGYIAEGYANVPVAENAALRLVAWSRRDAGYIDNVAGTRRYRTGGGCIRNSPRGPQACELTPNHPRRDFNDNTVSGARAALRVDLDENWTVTPVIMGQKHSSGGAYGFDPAVGDNEITAFYRLEDDDQWTQAALTIEGRLADFDVVYAGSLLNRNLDVESDYSDYSYFYDRIYNFYWIDDDFNRLANPSQWTTQHDQYRRHTHELRIASDADRRVRLIAGLFYQDNRHEIEARYRIARLASIISVPGWEDTLWLTRQARESTERALFGELSWDIDESWTLTAGLRWFDEDDANRGFFGYNGNYSQTYGTAHCFAEGGHGGIPCTNLDAHTGESDTVGRFNLSYRFDDERMVYATWSEGFRPGGVNRNDGSSYGPDYLRNYELGWKTSWRDDTVRLNGAVFRQDWEEVQFSYTPPQNAGLTVIRNVGTARIDGLEVDAMWSPLEGLQLGSGIAWLDARLVDDYTPRPGEPPVASKGDQLPIAPDFKGHLRGRFEFGLGGYTAHLQASAVYQGDRYGYLDHNARKNLPAYTLVDLGAGLAGESWSAELFALNAADTGHRVLNGYGCYPGVCTRAYYFPLTPRTIGFRFTQEF